MTAGTGSGQENCRVLVALDEPLWCEVIADLLASRLGVSIISLPGHIAPNKVEKLGVPTVLVASVSRASPYGVQTGRLRTTSSAEALIVVRLGRADDDESKALYEHPVSWDAQASDLIDAVEAASGRASARPAEPMPYRRRFGSEPPPRRPLALRGFLRRSTISAEKDRPAHPTAVAVLARSPLLREGFRTSFENQIGLTVTVTASSEGLDALERSIARCDVAVIYGADDVARGIRTFQELRRLPSGPPAVLIGRGSGGRAITAALRSGVSGYLTTGSSLAELSDCVRRVSQGEIVLPPGLLVRLLQSRIEKVRGDRGGRLESSRPAGSGTPREPGEASVPKQVTGTRLERWGNCILLWNSDRSRVLELNESAAAVWELCDSETSSQEMALALSDVLGVPRPKAIADIRGALDDLGEAGLLELDEAEELQH